MSVVGDRDCDIVVTDLMINNYAGGLVIDGIKILFGNRKSYRKLSCASYIFSMGVTLPGKCRYKTVVLLTIIFT